MVGAAAAVILVLITTWATFIATDSRKITVHNYAACDCSGIVTLSTSSLSTTIPIRVEYRASELNSLRFVRPSASSELLRLVVVSLNSEVDASHSHLFSSPSPARLLFLCFSIRKVELSPEEID